MLNRRELLRNGFGLMGAATIHSSPFWEFFHKKHFRIGACDWSIGKTADVTGLQLAKDIGLDGLQVSLGTLKNNMHLREKDIQQQYIKLSRQTGVKISSLGIGELNQVPYKSDPRTEEWVWDSIDVAKSLGVTVILLAFFSKGDLRNDPAGKSEVVKRLKMAAPKAEKMGITLGIESYLTAEEHLDIMDKVGSKAVKVYYDFRNAADAGNDVVKEIQLLGKDNICEIHMKENGFLLGEGTLDWNGIGRALEEIGYRGDGWMQIEWAKPNNMDLVKAYQHNLGFLRNLFK
jgi:sugar phosphate isomerase/epimerase